MLLDDDSTGKWSDESCTGTRDYVCEGDACPSDSSKTDPGQCGCGAPDTDTDADGTADCVDGCPNDAGKTAPGVCGCGVADADADGDGALTCQDECPADSKKVVAGDCGCSNAPAASGTSCDDGACTANTQCNGAGSCGTPAQCGAPDSQCSSGVRAGVTYWFCNNDRAYSDARTRCQNVGMDLAVIETSGEDNYVTGPITEHSYIGGSDQAVEGTWRWLPSGVQFWSGGPSGSAVPAGAYTNWESGEPSQSISSHDCITKDSSGSGQWEAHSCTVGDAYVCEQRDFCVFDSAKLLPGQCGCGVADTDSDMDGVANCNDACPDDPDKTVAGLCGCGVEDTDTDEDATPDCDDECPLDPANVESGDCGCVGEASLKAEGTACSDGACPLSHACDGAGVCGTSTDCSPASGCAMAAHAGRLYAFCPDTVAWSDARAACRAIPGMDLSHVEGSVEDEFIADQSSASSWVGATDAATEGTWRWTDDGAHFWTGASGGSAEGGRYEGWASGEPDNSSDEDCAAHAGAPNAWSDEDCDDARAFVCEVSDAALASGPDVTCASGGPWPGFRRCSSHQASAEMSAIPSPVPAASFSTGGAVQSSPAIGLDGAIYFGAQDGTLYALSSDGAVRWTYEAGGAISSSPAIAPDGIIYVGSDDHRLHAVGADGVEVWTYLTGGPVRSSPTIADDGTIYVGSDDNRLYAINPDGSKAWEYVTGGDVASSAAIGADGTVYFGSSDARLYALDAEGNEKWSFLTADDITASPALGSGGMVYVGSTDGTLYAINPGTGTAKWAYPSGAPIASSPAVQPDGSVVFGNDDGAVIALSPTGALKWIYESGDAVASSPAVDGAGNVIVGSDDGKLYALNGVDGTVLWSHVVGAAIASSPAIGPQGNVYVGSAASALTLLGALPTPTQSAITEISAAYHTAVVERLSGESLSVVADLAVTLAGYGESVDQLFVERGPRGQLTHLSGRFLALDLAPGFATLPSDDRAIEMIRPDRVLGKALGLVGGDELVLLYILPKRDGAVRFGFRQFWGSTPVHDAMLWIDLNAEGALTNLSNTTIPNLTVFVTPSTSITKGEAELIAIDDLLARNEPPWAGSTPVVTQSSRTVVYRYSFGGGDIAVPAFVIDLADENSFARRRVLVDENSGDVISSTDTMKEQTECASTACSGGSLPMCEAEPEEACSCAGPPFFDDSDPETASVQVWSGTDVLFQGGADLCPNLACGQEELPWPSGLGATATDRRDLDATAAALCGAATLFDEYVPTWAPGTTWQDWLTRTGAANLDSDDELEKTYSDLRIFLRADADIPSNTIAANGDDLAFRAGAARPAAIGHELIHTAVDSCSVAPQDRNGLLNAGDGCTAGVRTRALAADIEEHLGDVFGAILVTHVPLRDATPCEISDEEDTLSIYENEDPKPLCKAEVVPRYWRDYCNPRHMNNGHCSGAAYFTDLAEEDDDLNPGPITPENPSLGFDIPHTNLGVGNRITSALMGVRPNDPQNNFRIAGVDPSFFEDAYFGLLQQLGGATWSDYTRSWIEALMIKKDVGALAYVDFEERQFRSAFAEARIFAPPTPVATQVAYAFPFSVNTPLRAGASDTRIATATTMGPNGLERSYVFYKACSTDACTSANGDVAPIMYVWKNEVPRVDQWPLVQGNLQAELFGGGWAGPCLLFDGAELALTAHSPAAVGTDDSLFVAWNESADEPTEPELGTVKGMYLKAAGRGCGDVWASVDTGEPRELLGAPALGNWSNAVPVVAGCSADEPVADGPLRFPSEHIECHGVFGENDLLADRGLCDGAAMPCDASGSETGFCSVPDSAVSAAINATDLLLDTQYNGRIPTVLDPRSPEQHYVNGWFERRSLAGIFRNEAAAADAFRDAIDGNPYEDLVNCALAAKPGAPEALRVDARGYIADAGQPEQRVQTEGLAFSVDSLLLAFRDPEGVMRFGRFASDASELTELGDATSDPALATAASPSFGGAHVFWYDGSDLRYATTNGALNDTEGAFPRTSFSEGVVNEIADVRPVGRHVSYAKTAGGVAPVAVADWQNIHLFTGTNDDIRYSVLAPTEAFPVGPLTWVSERPVLLDRINTCGGACVVPPAVGGASFASRRGILRFYRPGLDGQLQSIERVVGYLEQGSEPP